jgi:hypothetical protein
MTEFSYIDIEDFYSENDKYPIHECEKCGNINEIEMKKIDIHIGYKQMKFEEIPVLLCQSCRNIQLSVSAVKTMIYVNKLMDENGQKVGEFKHTGYRKTYNYCQNIGFNYDHQDYESIPGLCVDEEHSNPGFLTPVYFDKKALLYFMYDPDYKLNFFSETYGTLSRSDDWGIPFGVNSNNKVVFWLGDLDEIDLQSKQILLPHNVASDHKVIDSEFYAAQLCCIWSGPNKEKKIFEKKKRLFELINNKYNIQLSHLEAEVELWIDEFQKPIVFTEKSIEPPINIMHKVLIEGINIKNFRKLYEIMYTTYDVEYKNWKTIKLYQAMLIKTYPQKSENEIKDLIGPIYLLNDLRIYFDHLLSNDKKESIRDNIIKSLEIEDFKDIKYIYNLLLDKSLILFEYLILGIEHEVKE